MRPADLAHGYESLVIAQALDEADLRRRDAGLLHRSLGWLLSRRSLRSLRSLTSLTSGGRAPAALSEPDVLVDFDDRDATSPRPRLPQPRRPTA
ncbi:MAG: hypothetical protein JWM64_69 [Frankiales bacterium]|nr:hypothetical protein [Frankiales bacterium]